MVTCSSQSNTQDSIALSKHTGKQTNKLTHTQHGQLLLCKHPHQLVPCTCPLHTQGHAYTLAQHVLMSAGWQHAGSSLQAAECSHTQLETSAHRRGALGLCPHAIQAPWRAWHRLGEMLAAGDQTHWYLTLLAIKRPRQAMYKCCSYQARCGTEGAGPVCMCTRRLLRQPAKCNTAC